MNAVVQKGRWQGKCSNEQWGELVNDRGDEPASSFGCLSMGTEQCAEVVLSKLKL